MQILTFDEATRSRLMESLGARSEAHSTARCNETQGFMMTLLSGPDALNPTNWLPEISGEESLSDAKEHTEIERLVVTVAADIRMKLNEKILPDSWFYEDEAGNPDFYTWCNACLYALDIVPTDWSEAVDQEEFEDLFYPIMTLGGTYDDEESGEAILRLDEKELTQLESDLPHVLLDIYWYWQAIINRPWTVRREGEKVGRNDPCPCGGGKEHKACCGK